MTLRVDPSEDFSRVLTSIETRRRTFETYAFNENGLLLSESRFDEQLRRIGLIGEDQLSVANIEIRDPGVNLVQGRQPKSEMPEQPFTRMVSGTLQLKLEMEKAGQTYGRSRIEIDTNGYRDYRGEPVFGAWLWNADQGLGMATENDVAEALTNYSFMDISERRKTASACPMSNRPSFSRLSPRPIPRPRANTAAPDWD